MSLSRTIRLLALFILLTTSAVFAQNPIPNSGFETWASSTPIDWITSEFSFSGSAVQTSSAHSGSWAIELNVVEFGQGFTVPPFMQTEEILGFPVSQKHATFSGFYDFTSVNDDVLLITIQLIKDGIGLGFAAFGDSTGTGGYTEFSVPITYFLDLVPDHAFIFATVMPLSPSGMPSVGTRVLLDDFSLVQDSASTCPIIMPGDLNESGTINTTDIIYMVVTLLKGGPAALPCAAAADVNCSGTLSTADIIYLVNSVLKAGPAPCNPCTLVPDTWSCP